MKNNLRLVLFLFLFLVAGSSARAWDWSAGDTTLIQHHILRADEIGASRPVAALAHLDSALRLAGKESRWLAMVLKAKGKHYRTVGDNQTAAQFFLQAADVSTTPGPWLSDIYLQAGQVLLFLTRLDSALIVLQKGVDNVKAFPDASTEAHLYNMMGNVMREQYKYNEALDHYIKATRLFEKSRNQRGLALSLSNLGNIYNLIDNSELALRYARESLTAARRAVVTASIGYSYRLIGRIYRKQGKFENALSAYDSALALFQQLQSKRDIGETYISIGNILFDLEKLDRATLEYKKGVAVIKSIPDSLLMAYAYAALGQAFFQLHQKSATVAYLDTAMLIAQKKKMTPVYMDCVQALSELYEREGDYKRSLAYYKSFVNLRDSVNRMQNRKEAKEIEERFESAKKDDAIRILNARNDLKSMQQRYLLAFTVITLIMALVLYNRYKVKRRANEKLKELDEVKSRFFINISHEFRTPLTLVITPLEKLVSQIGDRVSQNSLNQVLRNARELQRLTDQVLDLSRIEAGSLSLQVEETNIETFLRSIAGRFEPFAEAKSINFKTNLGSVSRTGCIDTFRVDTILSNLLSNAFKFTPEGGRIDLTADVKGEQLHIEVKDNGVGIPSDKLNKVFERFYQVDDEKKITAGTGVGLALAKELAELHRGRLLATSTPGQGSTFVLEIPVNRETYSNVQTRQVKPDAVENLSVVPASPSDHSFGDESKPLVLVAEDHEEMLKLVAGIVGEYYRVEPVRNGADALLKAKELIPDIIVTDWMMPGMDGRTFCEQIRNMSETCHIPVLMLTARVDDVSKMEGLETGVDDYLTKPFKSTELLVRIRNLIRQRALLREVFRQRIVVKPAELNLPSRDTEFLERVLSLLELNYSDSGFDVDRLASETGLSRMQLHRKLKALTDQSPGEFIRRFRLERARQMLSVPGVQVSEVCYKVGFNNVSNFSKAFREFAEMTPTEFMEQHEKAAKN